MAKSFKGDYSDRWDSGEGTKLGDLDRIGQALGVKKSDFYNTGHEDDYDQFRPGGEKAYLSAIKRAANNNYDMRETLKAANLAGVEGAPKRIRNAEDVADAYRFMENTWKKEGFDDHKGGGFNAYGDRAAVTDFYVNKDRDELLKEIMDKEQDETFLDPKADEVESPYKATEFWQNLVEDPHFERYEEVPPERGYTSDDSAVSFKNKYMTDLTEGLNLGGKQTLNLKNAMNAVGTAEAKQGHINYMSKFKDPKDP